MNAPITLPAVGSDPSDAPVTLASVVAVLRRRRVLLLWPVAVLLFASALSCFFATRRYRATAEIQVQKENSSAFGLGASANGQDQATPGDSLDYNITLQTEAGILRSPALALAVIPAAHLESTPDYFAPGSAAPHAFSLLGWTKRLPWRKPLEPLTTPLAEAPNRRYADEAIFASHLKVLPQPGTRLIDISYTDRDPARAAAVANTVTRVLAELTFQQRFTSTLQGSSWLSGQLNDLRARTEQAQAKAAALERGTGMFGNDASRNVVLERLDSLNQTLTAAESNRILKESIDKVAASGSPELISSLSGNSSTGSVASISTSLTLIQGLRQQEAQVHSELAEDSVRYGPAYPKVSELKAQLAGIGSSIAAETTRLGQRAHTDWQIAVRQEAGARSAFDHQKQLATRQNDSVIAYQLARQEADSSRDLYEGLLTRLKQTNLLEGLRASNISVVGAAQVPPPDHPASPNVLLRMAAALAAGLLLGFGAAVFAELTDSSIQSLTQVESVLGVPLLAVLPAIQGLRPRFPDRLSGRTLASKASRRLQSGYKTPAQALPAPRKPASLPAMLPVPLPVPLPLPVLDQRLSVFSEGLRSLRTVLQLSGSGGPPQVILVTSCLASEGKTTLAVNLAALFAQGGARVLLVDADLRRPTLHHYGHASQEAGLAMALSGPENVPPRQPIASMPNLSMLCGSEIAPFPSELLGSARMEQLLSEWRSAYDIIVLDSPPVLPVTDAVLLSRHSDATLLVARHRQTTHQALRRGIETLQRQSTSRGAIGVVLNDVAPGSGDFYQYFGYEGGIYASQGA